MIPDIIANLNEIDMNFIFPEDYIIRFNLNEVDIIFSLEGGD